MPRAEFDFSELDRWTDLLERAPKVVEADARRMLNKAALNVKDEARQNAPGDGAAKHYPSSINYDIFTDGQELVAEIGPAEGRRQWGLGNLFEYGSAHNPPHPHLEPALDNEEPRFIKAAEDLTAEPFE